MYLSTGAFAVVAAGLFLYRQRLGVLASTGGVYLAGMAWLVYGFDPPTPRSVVFLYAIVATLAVGLYLTSSDQVAREAWRPIHRLLVDPARSGQRITLYALVPSLVAFATFQSLMPDEIPPPTVRSAHPAPPATIDLRSHTGESRTFDVLAEDSPYRGVAESDPEAWAAAVSVGRTVYFENCFFCHGDTLAADGHYADVASPPPADFTDVAVLPMFVDGFFFWRIAKGGPGLPPDGTPWDSTMPAWEDFLTEDEMWAVLAYLTDATGYEPRVRETYADH